MAAVIGDERCCGTLLANGGKVATEHGKKSVAAKSRLLSVGCRYRKLERGESFRKGVVDVFKVSLLRTDRGFVSVSRDLMAALQVTYLYRSAVLVSTSGDRRDEEGGVDVREWLRCVARMALAPASCANRRCDECEGPRIRQDLYDMI